MKTMNEWTTEASRSVVRHLEQNGFEAVYVGGAIRDLIRGERPDDIDIATSATPEEVMRLFSHTIDVGSEHGTTIIVQNGEMIEVTTYRTETTYSDFRRPDEVTFVRSLEDDLKRRDFTMNAIACRSDGTIIDPFGGVCDIEQGIIRAVGTADERFSEDALRMLRAIRFAGVLGFTIEDDTFRAIERNRSLLAHVAVERIVQEVDKLLEGKHVEHGWTMFQQTQLAEQLPPFDRIDRWTFPLREATPSWAYIFSMSGDSLGSFCTAYKLSNERKRAIRRFHEAKRLVEDEAWDVYATYSYSVHERVVGTLLAGGSVDGRAFQVEKEALPIQSFEELAATGKELMKWTNRRGGPWLGELIRAMERAVVSGQLLNEEQRIRKWVMEHVDER